MPPAFFGHYYHKNARYHRHHVPPGSLLGIYAMNIADYILGLYWCDAPCMPLRRDSGSMPPATPSYAAQDIAKRDDTRHFYWPRRRLPQPPLMMPSGSQQNAPNARLYLMPLHQRHAAMRGTAARRRAHISRFQFPATKRRMASHHGRWWSAY